MFKYKLYYDGGFLRDSADLGYTFESEEEAQEDAKMEIENVGGKIAGIILNKAI